MMTEFTFADPDKAFAYNIITIDVSSKRTGPSTYIKELIDCTHGGPSMLNTHTAYVTARIITPYHTVKLLHGPSK
jgi:hypothetical protein